MVDLIVKKRDGEALTADEIRWMIGEYTRGNIPDYQMAAFAMAVYFRGMDASETAALTLAMAASGEQLDLSHIPGVKVDKHSTGGVGDKTTLVLVPLVASCGLPVAKMSGRGLGHAGGTLDKLESIPGVRTELAKEDFLKQLERVGAVICAQTGNFTPADKALYALRDVTGTVESVPLIAASVMSKKIAAGADAFVLDVKAGRAAYMKTEAEAVQLAQALIDIARGAGRRAVAWVTAMDQPLGWAVGNALEAYEAARTLQGQGPADLVELCLELGAEMLMLGGVASERSAARAALRRAFESGAGYEKFTEIVAAQGGSVSAFEEALRRGHPPGYYALPVTAPFSGFVAFLDGLEVGRTAMALGAGRATAADAIDHHVGIVVHKKGGDRVLAGEPLATIVARERAAAERAAARLERAYSLRREEEGPPPSPRPLLRRRLASEEEARA